MTEAMKRDPAVDEAMRRYMRAHDSATNEMLQRWHDSAKAAQRVFDDTLREMRRLRLVK